MSFTRRSFCYTFLAEFDFQNTNSTSLAAVPTGAIIETNGLGLAGNTGTAGGNNLSSAPAISLPLSSTGIPQVSANPRPNGGKVFPAPVAQCGDGVGSDAGPCSIMGVDPNLRDPYIINWNLGIQHAFTSNLSLEVGMSAITATTVGL